MKEQDIYIHLYKNLHDSHLEAKISLAVHVHPDLQDKTPAYAEQRNV